VYAATPEEAVQRTCAYIDLCNQASTASQPDDGAEEAEDDDVEEEPDELIGYQPDIMRPTLLATSTTQLDDENVFDGNHILIFETRPNE
jgi:hypothetical protein